MAILNIYTYITSKAEPLFVKILEKRLKKGKESSQRWKEKMGVSSVVRPNGHLYWVHAASVGEIQAALIIIRYLLTTNPDLNILITTGTLTSAKLVEVQNLPRTIHQFAPLDVPKWVNLFHEHWKPDMVFWMESELWPNTLLKIKSSNTPALLLNARLSDRSYKKWKIAKPISQKLLECFSIIFCQTHEDKEKFKSLGANEIIVSDNLKYSAAPLSHDVDHYKKALAELGNRPCWVYASTHADEEIIAANIHEKLKLIYPNILTIIIPRHPERTDQIIEKIINENKLNLTVRGNNKKLFNSETDIYIANTIGELGLFYRLTPIAMIGRSLSNDGGGGHNPIEAAQLNCAIIHGVNIQNLKEIYEELDAAQGAISVANTAELYDVLQDFLKDHNRLNKIARNANNFARSKAAVLERIKPHIDKMILAQKIS